MNCHWLYMYIKAKKIPQIPNFRFLLVSLIQILLIIFGMCSNLTETWHTCPQLLNPHTQKKWCLYILPLVVPCESNTTNRHNGSNWWNPPYVPFVIRRKSPSTTYFCVSHQASFGRNFILACNVFLWVIKPLLEM